MRKNQEKLGQQRERDIYLTNTKVETLETWTQNQILLKKQAKIEREASV